MVIGMAIELRLWRSFVMLAEERSFRRAADRLGVSQPALTKQMQELEARLGVTLVRREPRGIELTDAATASLEDARALIASAERLEQRVRAAEAEAAQELTIGAREYISRGFLPRAIQNARRRFPSLRAKVEEMSAIEAAAAAADGRVDLGIAISPVVEPNLVAKPIVSGRWMIVLPADHGLAAGDQVAVEALCDEQLVLFARRLNPDLYDRLIASLDAKAAGYGIAYHAQDPSVGLDMAANGIGLFVAASYALPALPDGLLSRPLSGFDETLTINAVWRRDRMTPALRALVDSLGSVDAEP